MQGNAQAINQIFNLAWGKLFKRKLFENIEFLQHSDAEDVLTAWKLYIAAKRIGYKNIAGYCWKIRPESASSMSTQNQHIKLWQNIYYCF